MIPVPAVDVSYDCESVFDYATTTYNVTLLWTIENNECSVISNIVRFEITLRSGTQSSTLNRLIDPKEVASYHISPVSNNTIYVIFPGGYIATKTFIAAAATK